MDESYGAGFVDADEGRQAIDNAPYLSSTQQVDARVIPRFQRCHRGVGIWFFLLRIFGVVQVKFF